MYIIGVAACPTGVAHTYMAAEAIKKACKEAGHDVKVETQGAGGIENQLTKEDVEKADFVIITKDIAIIGEDRFKGKHIAKVTTGDAIKNAKALIKKIEEYIKKNNADNL
ncbi:PTS fructose-like transporter subunit IIB [Thermoanaerobacterium thermosaccharolyticum]|uniref:PTS fructose-like transporter subunit IIB n=1 Tax=Thermoanaerobacterium thermosaccharolyticum TaxID=1517 RepID=UPI003DA9B964